MRLQRQLIDAFLRRFWQSCSPPTADSQFLHPLARLTTIVCAVLATCWELNGIAGVALVAAFATYVADRSNYLLTSFAIDIAPDRWHLPDCTPAFQRSGGNIMKFRAQNGAGATRAAKTIVGKSFECGWAGTTMQIIFVL
jgi:hypothetical protein